MDHGTPDPTPGVLRKRLEQASALGTEPDRSLAIVGVVNEGLATLEPPFRAVIVGGKAVDYWTAGEFATADTDLLIPASDKVDACLRLLGFERIADGRHWEHPDFDVLIEMPGSGLSHKQRADQVETRIPGGSVPVLSLVDTLIQRLHECAATGAYDAAEQAAALRQVPGLDLQELRRRAKEERLEHALDGLEELLQQLKDGRQIETWDVHRVFDKR